MEFRYFKSMGIRIMILELPTTLTDFLDTNKEMADMMLEFINNVLIELNTTLVESEMHKCEKRQREGLEQLKSRSKINLCLFSICRICSIMKKQGKKYLYSNGMNFDEIR